MSFFAEDDDIVAIGKNVFDIEIAELLKVKDKLDDDFKFAVKEILECSGRVVVTGVGKSGIIGRKIAASFSSVGTQSVYMSAAEGLHGDLGMINYIDIVLAISNSGSSDEVMQLIPSIKKIGAKIIALTGNPDSPLAKVSDIVLNIGVEKEACPMNIAPTSSTTATLLMGDALMVALIEKRGFTAEKFAIYHPGGALGRRLLTKVCDVMQPIENVAIATKDDTLLTIVDKLTKKNLGIVCIIENELVIGIITDGDIRRALHHYGADFFIKNAESIMTVKFKAIASEKLAIEALEIMENSNSKISSLPVIVSGHLKGLVRLHDVYDCK